ncbi:ABC transporter substrate-binding protein [Paenarthrobacter sp. OM7]|uniref:ABC transporter substrate-binding protein n=1 Tax=Paenarthrobacter sp. OM7 TaxID=3041264 RepID=UPI00246898D2|nr:ABC transporter substrate-binding protein [Paenarthrobacter sp. OM7]WGM20602.1 ABC transporter substrate-binding protein [Paenarthrobacter sp. OM7]
MSHPIDVGSVLGGRYKVTANVLTSHDQDQVLDGVDQVLNRPVSILVAGPGNAEQVAQSAREVATGERPGHVQILDLGVSDNTTYLITNHSSAPDLLDLVVATNPPYIEPFFTETLGSEIFGQPRTYEPETYDGLYEDDEHDAEYIQYDENGYPIHREGDADPAAAPQGSNVPPRPASSPSSSKSGIAGKLAAAAAGAGAAGLAAWKNSGSKNHDAGAAADSGAVAGNSAADSGSGAAASSASSSGAAGSGASAQPPTQAVTSQPTPPQAPPAAPAQPPTQPRTQAVNAQPAPTREPAEPKVSLWSEEDYGFAGGAAAGGAAAGTAAAARGTADSSYDRAPSSFPASAAVQEDYDDEEVYEDDAPEKEPRSLRWLVGGLLAAVLIVGLVLAVTNLGSLLPSGAPAATQSTSAPQTSSTQQSEEPTPTETASPATPPAIEGISRLGDFPFAATYDKDLARAFDGNAASYWSDMEFATADWGGLVTNMPLVIELKEKTEVKSIVLNQLGGSGGSISVYTNDRPAMDGAKLVGTNSFTSPELTMPLAAPTQTQYVIVDIKALPKLAAPKTRFGFGLRLAEVTVQ